jgi:hypothetical protein
MFTTRLAHGTTSFNFIFLQFLYLKFNFGRALAGYISWERIWILTSLSICLSLIVFIQKSYEDWHPKHWTGSETERCISCMSHYLRTGLLVFGTWRYVQHTRTLNPWQRWRRSMFLWNMWNQSPHKEVWHPGRLKSLITALKTSEIQNSLFIVYNMTIKKFTL